MYNQLMYEVILSKYGAEKTIDFCRMASDAYQHVYDVLNNEKGNPYETYMDYGYDANWWNKKAEELLNKNNNND